MCKKINLFVYKQSIVCCHYLFSAFLLEDDKFSKKYTFYYLQYIYIPQFVKYILPGQVQIYDRLNFT